MSTPGAAEGHELLVIPWLATSGPTGERGTATAEWEATTAEWEATTAEWEAAAAEWGSAIGRETATAEHPTGGTAERGAAGTAEWITPVPRPARSEEQDEDFASAVRPYTWTQGRTQPVCDLAMEALVSTIAQGRHLRAFASLEHRAVAELCREPRSVAEVAALLALPLGVARVLLGDMADIGLVMVHRTATDSGEVPEFGFMERVLSGLRRL